MPDGFSVWPHVVVGGGLPLHVGQEFVVEIDAMRVGRIRGIPVINIVPDWFRKARDGKGGNANGAAPGFRSAPCAGPFLPYL